MEVLESLIAPVLSGVITFLIYYFLRPKKSKKKKEEDKKVQGGEAASAKPRGILADIAARVLMKLLYAASLAWFGLNQL